ncbi:MAG: hypothetical protein ACFB0G_20135 [Leptolyngbyaceae cyanobacterium]
MTRQWVKQTRRNCVWLTLWVLVWRLCSGAAEALSDRFPTFPNGTNEVSIPPTEDDLIYPMRICVAALPIHRNGQDTYIPLKIISSYKDLVRRPVS